MHVPFCRHICGYCDFCRTVYSSELAEQWLNALETELEYKKIHSDIQTVYIGGGTPTSLEAPLLDRLFQLLEPYTSNVQEYTIEINPETFDGKKAELFKQYGVNRASIGLQTANEKLLKMIGRHHTPEDVLAAINLLRSLSDIHNISLDLMYSLPGQTMQDVEDAFDFVRNSGVPHVSLYSLTIEPGSVFGKTGKEPLDEDTEADMYERLISLCEANGYHQYEISSFAKEGCESNHNKAYWHYDDFIGIGAGASGKENHIRYDHTKVLREYMENPIKTEKTILSHEDEMFEEIMMRLRLKKEGIDRNEFKKRYGLDVKEAFPHMEKLIRENLLVETEDRIVCSETGFPVLNSILVSLMP